MVSVGRVRRSTRQARPCQLRVLCYRRGLDQYSDSTIIQTATEERVTHAAMLCKTTGAEHSAYEARSMISIRSLGRFNGCSAAAYCCYFAPRSQKLLLEGLLCCAHRVRMPQTSSYSTVTAYVGFHISFRSVLTLHHAITDLPSRERFWLQTVHLAVHGADAKKLCAMCAHGLCARHRTASLANSASTSQAPKACQCFLLSFLLPCLQASSCKHQRTSACQRLQL